MASPTMSSAVHGTSGHVATIPATKKIPKIASVTQMFAIMAPSQ
jgi:hypothetical protein